VCPGGAPTGYTYFIPQEELLESRVMTRGYMESRMVVLMAGRCARAGPPPHACPAPRERAFMQGNHAGAAAWRCYLVMCERARCAAAWSARSMSRITCCRLTGGKSSAQKSLLASTRSPCCGDPTAAALCCHTRVPALQRCMPICSWIYLHSFQGPCMRPPSCGPPTGPAPRAGAPSACCWARAACPRPARTT